LLKKGKIKEKSKGKETGVRSMELFITGGFFLLVVFLIINNTKDVKIILPEEEKEEVEEVDKKEAIDQIQTELRKGYTDETFEALTNFKQEYYTTSNEENIVKLNKRWEEWLRKKEEKKNKWEEIGVKIDELIEERKHFITKETFYPRDYSFAIVEFELAKEKIKEYIIENPMKKDLKIIELMNLEENKVSEYRTIKKTVEEKLPILKKYESEKLKKNEELEYFKRKQEMILELQNGNTKVVKKILKELIKKTQ
jgi:hypothetical protein